MRYELIEGDTRLINQLVKDGWKIENTFPNPYPKPYFFALMYLKSPFGAYNYDVQQVKEYINGNVAELKQWKNL